MRLLLLALLTLCACGPSGNGSGSGSPPAPQSEGPWLVLTGAHLGELEPCGCSKPKLGGIEQRAVLYARRYQGRAVLVDTGDAVRSPGRQQELKYDAFIAALNETGYHAAAVGPRDLLLGLDVLTTAAKQAKFPLLAANLLDPDEKHPFKAWHRVPAPGGGAVIVVGLLPGDATLLEEGARIESPAAALERALAEAKPEIGESLAVVGGFDTATARALEATAATAGVPALIVYSRGKAPPDTRLDGVSIGLGGRGRYMMAFDLPAKIGRWQDPVVHRVEEGERQEAILAIIYGYQDRIRDEDLLSKVARAKPEIGYVGTAKCSSCHAEAHDAWLASRHSKAMRSLVAVKHQYDPECVSCHVTGMRVVGGYVDRESTSEFARVSCESCHGAGAVHAAKPTKLNIRRGGEATCLDCHVKDHDPNFDYSKRWPSIEH